MAIDKLEDFTKNLTCCSILEEEIFRLYKTVAKKMKQPELRSRIISIGYNSFKHSMVIKEVVRPIEKSELKPKDKPKAISKLLAEVAEVSKQIEAVTLISDKEFIELFKALTDLEDRLIAIYASISQPRILRPIASQLETSAPSNLKNLIAVFKDIIRDKEMHREVLLDVGYFFASKEQQSVDTTPIVRYTNPDKWMSPQAF